MIRFIQCVILIAIIIATLLTRTISTSASVVFFLLVTLFLSTLADRKISLISAFTFAFAYMIPPEAILGESELIARWGEPHVVTGYRVLVFSFVAVFSGFLLFRKPMNTHERAPSVLISSASQLEFAKYVFLGLTIFCVVIFSPMITYGLTTGRGSSSLYNPDGEGGLLFGIGPLGYFLFSLTYAICGFWGYYYSRNKNWGALLKAIAFSAPIYLIGIASGTRYMLCFMLSSTLLPWCYRLSIKKIKWIAVGGLAVVLLFTAMKSSRYTGFDFASLFEETQTEQMQTVTEQIVSKGSPEGLIRNMAMIDLWTTTHAHTYGASIGFIGVFWIPRFIWQNKPTQIDFWLIREYETGYTSAFSTASSFCGELFMDFGYGCVVACFLLGILMAKLDTYIDKNLVSGGFFPTALAGVMLGWAFFVARSFMTASYPLLLGIPVIWILNKTITKESRRRLPPPPIPSNYLNTFRCMDAIRTPDSGMHPRVHKDSK